MRLDQFLFSKKISPSRSQITKWIREGYVLLNGKRVKAAYQVKPNDDFQIVPPKIKPSIFQAEAIPLEILYEDDDLIVINKSSNIVVHPGAGHREGTLVHALLAHCHGLSQIGGVERPGIVHRLDKGTSGVMVVAKNDATHIHLAGQFKNHQIKKIYWALCFGKIKNKEGTLETFITRSPSHRKKYAVSEKQGKKAITHYQVLGENNGLSLVELNLETGRTHQIRVHLNHLGHSVVGDPLYGGHAKKVKQIQNIKLRGILEKVDHTLLHAHTLEFIHPQKNQTMLYQAKLPNDFKEAIKHAKLYSI